MFSFLVVDYSVQVSHLDREEIMMKLGTSAREAYTTEVMRKSLTFHLKKKHPLHKRVKQLKSAQLFELCHGLSIRVPRREKAKMEKLVKDHFFSNFPDAPLTNLNRIMEEDIYFAELTGKGIINF